MNIRIFKSQVGCMRPLVGIIMVLVAIFVASSAALGSTNKRYYWSDWETNSAPTTRAWAQSNDVPAENVYRPNDHTITYAGDKVITIYPNKDQMASDGDRWYFTGESFASNQVLVRYFHSKGGVQFTYSTRSVCFQRMDQVEAYFHGNSRYWHEELDEQTAHSIFIYQAPQGHSLTFDVPESTILRSTVGNHTVKFTPGYHVTSRNFEVRFYDQGC